MVHIGASTKRVQSRALTKIYLYPRAQYSRLGLLQVIIRYTVFAIRRFNDSKTETLSQSCHAECNDYVSHIRYLIICSEARRMTSHWCVSHRDTVTNNACSPALLLLGSIQLKWTITIVGKLYPVTITNIYKYPLDRFLCHNLYAEL